MDSTSLRFYMKQHPFKMIPSAKDGAPPNQFVTGPMRVQFSHLEKGRENERGELGYDCVLIAPPESDLTIPKTMFYEAAVRRFGQNYGSIKDFKSPFKNQKDLATKYPGFADVESAKFFQSGSRFVIPAFDRNKLPIPITEIYDGAWVIALLNVYAYPKDDTDPKKKRGVGFGLRSLQKIADDERLMSPGADPSRAFDEVQSHGGGSPAPAAATAAPPANIPGF